LKSVEDGIRFVDIVHSLQNYQPVYNWS